MTATTQGTTGAKAWNAETSLAPASRATTWTRPMTGDGSDMRTDPAPSSAACVSAAHTTDTYALDEFTGEVVCTAITRLTHDVADFTFRSRTGGPLPFAPGQYYTFRFASLGLERCYSVASAPEPAHAWGTSAGEAGIGAMAMGSASEITITVKRVPGGPVSAHLHDELSVGDTLWADGPYGVFGTDVRPGAHALYLSGGSGITPFLSMMRARRSDAESTATTTARWDSVVHVHSARTPADIVHREELASMSGTAGMTMIPVCSADSAAEPWYGIRGRVTAEKLAAAVPDVASREVLVCGPTGYTAAVFEMLATLGVPAHRIHTESYVFGQSLTPAQTTRRTRPQPARVEQTRTPTAEAPATGGGDSGTPVTGARPLPPCFSVEFRSAGRTVECPADTTLLDAAHAAGIPHASSCAEGVCGTCKAVKISGDVEMDHAGGIRPREVREGKILPCCSVPLSDVVME